LPHSTKRDLYPVTRRSRGQFDIIRDSCHLFPIPTVSRCFSRSRGRHPIRHIIEEHAPDHEEELSRDGDGGPLSSPEVFQLEVLQPHRRVFRDEYPCVLALTNHTGIRCSDLPCPSDTRPITGMADSMLRQCAFMFTASRHPVDERFLASVTSAASATPVQAIKRSTALAW